MNIEKLTQEKIEEVLPDSYLMYAKYVAQSRAIVDSRDFLKDGARKIIYAQWKNKITHDKPFKKGTKNIAAAMSYSVHGSGPIYGNMVRMAQPFSLRYPLCDYDGNVGTLSQGSDYAADRYLNLRSSSISGELMKNINKNTIDEWRDNYDETEKYPTVLPAYFPNIVNGASGIGVGLACSIPSFNLNEVCDALILLLEKEDATFEEIYCPVDFPTGATVVNENEVKESLKSGKGKSVKIKATIDYDDKKRELVVKELPYQVFTSTICEQIQNKIDNGVLTGIESFFDATGYGGISIRIKLTKHANPKKVLFQLYKHTSLTHHYGINMVMLENGTVPKVFSWKMALITYLNHLKNSIRKSYEYDLKTAIRRLHLVEGFIKAIVIIDEIVKLIKSSKNSAEAEKSMIEKYGFTSAQAKAILDMKLSRLTNLELNKLEKEKADLEKEIDHINFILNDDFINEVKKELLRIKKQYGDERRTKVLNIEETGENDEPVEKKVLVVYLSEKGQVQAQEADQYMLQMRGGAGARINIGKGDIVRETIYADNGSWVLVFTNKGKAHTLYLNDLEIGANAHVSTLLDFEAGEEVVALLPYKKAKDFSGVIISTEKGYLKKTIIKDFISKTKKPVWAIKLREGDSISSVSFVEDGDELLIASKNGHCIKIDEVQVPATGRQTMGVQGLKLNPGDSCVSCCPIRKKANEMCSITKKGLIKRTPIKEISKTNRGTKGVIAHKLNEGDELVSIVTLVDEKTISAVSSTNIIKLSIAEVPQTGRACFGVNVMKKNSNIVKIFLTK